MTPLSGAPSLRPLARVLLDALGLGSVDLPDALELVPRRSWTRAVGEARVSLGVDTYEVDPYGGGASKVEWMRVDGLPDRSLRVSLSEIAWVGPELKVVAGGAPAWVAAVAEAVAAYLAQNQR